MYNTGISFDGRRKPAPKAFGVLPKVHQMKMIQWHVLGTIIIMSLGVIVPFHVCSFSVYPFPAAEHRGISLCSVMEARRALKSSTLSRCVFSTIVRIFLDCLAVGTTGRAAQSRRKGDDLRYKKSSGHFRTKSGYDSARRDLRKLNSHRRRKQVWPFVRPPPLSPSL